MQIEDEKCPFCANPNPFAVEHRQDMQRYHREFQETRQEVEKKARHFNSLTAKVTVIAVLFAMVIGMIVIENEGPYRIWSNHLHRDISKNEQEYREILRTYEQEGDWQSFYAFYDAQNIGFADVIREYRGLYFMCSDYKCILNEFTRYDAENEYDSGTAAASRIAAYLDSFYKAAHRISYEGQYYEESYTLQRRLL